MHPPAARGECLGRCDASATLGYCREYSDSGWSMETADADCAFMGSGIFVHSSCSRMNAVAECLLGVSTPDGISTLEVREIYYNPAFPLEKAKEACQGRLTPLLE